MILRDIHQLWCDDPACPPDWHLTDADPTAAATRLALALWNMADAAASGDPNAEAAIRLLNARIADELA